MLGGTPRRALARSTRAGRPLAHRGTRTADRTADRTGAGRTLAVAGTGAALAFTAVLVPGLLLDGSAATGTGCTPLTQPLGPATGYT